MNLTEQTLKSRNAKIRAIIESASEIKMYKSSVNRANVFKSQNTKIGAIVSESGWNCSLHKQPDNR